MFRNKFFYNFRSQYLILFFLLFSLTACSIGDNNAPKTSHKIYDITTEEAKEQQALFDNITEDAFKEYVSASTLDLHYSLKNPKKFDITTKEITWGDMDINNIHDITEITTCLTSLQAIHYNLLKPEQQLTYDILKSYLTTEQENSNLYLYVNIFQPYLGIHSNLPILMSEYQFYSKKDIDDYLKLLKKLPPYISYLLQIETMKSEKGLFMPDFCVDETVQQCKDIIVSPSNNILIDTFNNRINNMKNLSKQQKEEYRKTNKEYIYAYLIPAYQSIINQLTDLKGTSTNQKGLYYYKDGKQYYKYLLKSSVGTNKTPEQLIKLLNKELQACNSRINNIQKKASNIYNDYTNMRNNFEPNSTLKLLSNSINGDFPIITGASYTIKYVPKSLESSMSPAFYLIPPIDDVLNNTIYINRGSVKSGCPLIIDLAHEGYPGHLYQNVYFKQTNTSNIRKVLPFTGYTEGWALYVQQYAYKYTEYSPELQDYSKEEYIYNMLLQARIDMGIHYEGWDVAETSRYVKKWGYTITDDSFYEAYIANPGHTLNYCIGYLEMLELKKKCKAKLGSDYSDLAFHEFILSTGPCPFNILNQQLSTYNFNTK